MWGIFLSEPLPIVGLVGRCPANCLMGRMPTRDPLVSRLLHVEPACASGLNPPFGGLSPFHGKVAYALLTHSPVAGSVLLHPDAPRLACVRPVASVHPEPGSNSSLYYNVFVFSLFSGSYGVSLPAHLPA